MYHLATVAIEQPHLSTSVSAMVCVCSTYVHVASKIPIYNQEKVFSPRASGIDRESSNSAFPVGFPGQTGGVRHK